MATRWQNIPSLDEDVVERVREDMQKSRKGRNVESSKLSGAAKDVVREAGSRATNRNLSRLGMAGAALQSGYEVGREIDERTGAGKKLVDAMAGKAIDKAAAGERVELSKEAKQRQKDYEEADADLAAASLGYAKGGKVGSASKRADGIAQRGKTRGKYL